MDDAGLVNAELDLASLGVLDSGSDIGSHGADLGVRHQAARAQDLAQRTHHAHGVGSSDDHVERHVAGLDFGGQVVHAHHVGASSLGFFSLGTLGEHGNALGLAGAVGHHDGATHHLVGFLGVHAQLHGHVDGFIELGVGALFHQSQRISDGVQLGGFHLAFEGFLFLGQLGHVTHPPQSRPWNGRSQRWYARRRPDRQQSDPSSWSWRFLPAVRG